MPRKHKALLTGVGKGLKERYGTASKPLNWSIIDVLEKLAERERDPPTSDTNDHEAGRLTKTDEGKC